MSGGGGCVEEGGATCGCYPGALPRFGGEGDPTGAKRRGRGGGGLGADLGVGKARPGPRSHRALPEHPAEVAVPRVLPRCGRGRWPVSLAVVGGEGRFVCGVSGC